MDIETYDKYKCLECGKIECECESDTKPCTKCNGSGKGGILYPECPFCQGKGSFTKPDVVELCQLIKGRKGLRSARPKDNRAYYVWRLTRFYGGADVTMPMNAMYSIEGDPYQKELDAIAEAVANVIFGTDMAAAHRWGSALGYINEDVPGLPDSSYSGGRVADENKPAEEAEELK